MWLDTLWFIGGFGCLFVGAHYFVEGAIGLSQRSGLSSLWIGIVVVGFATSVPEIIFSTLALWDNHYGLALGNPIGSYIANIGVVLGGCACCIPLRIRQSLFRCELPILLLVVALAAIVFWDGFFGRMDVLLLLVALLLLLLGLVYRARGRDVAATLLAHTPLPAPNRRWLPQLIGGFIALWGGGQGMVKGAAGIAHVLGLSDLTIGLTVVAVGTSLPELAAAIASAKKGHYDLALGNVIGSNVLCILGIMSLPGLWQPQGIAPELLARDVPMMLLFTLLLWWTAYGGKKEQGFYVISRVEGLVLLLSFMGYVYWVAIGSI